MMNENSSLKRITLSSIWAYILEIVNFERGIFYTIKALAFYPGSAIREFLFENRNKLMKPIKFLVVSVAVSAVVTHYCMPSDTDILESVKAQLAQYKLPENIAATFEKVQVMSKKYPSVLAVLSVPFLALISFYMFSKKQFNFAEHLILNSYLLAFMNIISIVLAFIFWMKINWLITIIGVLPLFYILFFYIQVFELPFWKGWGRALFALLLIQIMSSVVNLLIGVIVHFFF